jgi:hypothetical protein
MEESTRFVFQDLKKEKELLHCRHWQSQAVPFLKEYYDDLLTFVETVPTSDFVKNEIKLKMAKIKHLVNRETE